MTANKSLNCRQDLKIETGRLSAEAWEKAHPPGSWGMDSGVRVKDKGRRCARPRGESAVTAGTGIPENKYSQP